MPPKGAFSKMPPKGAAKGPPKNETLPDIFTCFQKHLRCLGFRLVASAGGERCRGRKMEVEVDGVGKGRRKGRKREGKDGRGARREAHGWGRGWGGNRWRGARREAWVGTRRWRGARRKAHGWGRGWGGKMEGSEAGGARVGTGLGRE